MHFQNYFANSSIKLEILTSHLQHSRPCYISGIQLSPSARVYIRYNTAAHVVNST